MKRPLLGLLLVWLATACVEAKSGFDRADFDASAASDAGMAADAEASDAEVTEADAGTDGGPDARLFDARLPNAPSAFAPGVGGPASSTNYRVDINIGQPEPLGVATSANYRLILEPGSAR